MQLKMDFVDNEQPLPSENHFSSNSVGANQINITAIKYQSLLNRSISGKI